MNSVRYIGLDVHRDTISAAVLDEMGRLMQESVLATRAAAILDFVAGVRGAPHVTLEEGTRAVAEPVHGHHRHRQFLGSQQHRCCDNDEDTDTLLDERCQTQGIADSNSLLHGSLQQQIALAAR